MPHTRAHIRFNTTKDVTNFVQQMNSDGSTNKYILENFDGMYRADARSFLGVMYMFAECNDEIYLVNVTKDSEFPFFIDDYRI